MSDQDTWLLSTFECLTQQNSRLGTQFVPSYQLPNNTAPLSNPLKYNNNAYTSKQSSFNDCGMSSETVGAISSHNSIKNLPSVLFTPNYAMKQTLNLPLFSPVTQTTGAPSYDKSQWESFSVDEISNLSSKLANYSNQQTNFSNCVMGTEYNQNQRKGENQPTKECLGYQTQPNYLQPYPLHKQQEQQYQQIYLQHQIPVKPMIKTTAVPTAPPTMNNYGYDQSSIPSIPSDCKVNYQGQHDIKFYNKSTYHYLPPPPTDYETSNVHCTPSTYFDMTSPAFLYKEQQQQQQQQQQPSKLPEISQAPQQDCNPGAGKVCSSKKKQNQLKNPYRRVRPKVVESKGAIQCAGMNLKKGIRCRNAALMEYIGPRPIYCAEHIELDPETMYIKCRSSYGKFPGDGKGCKEVVLKDFVMCYKHFEDRLNSLPESEKLPVARNSLVKVEELLIRLEQEAAAAKRKRHDLFQRKNKLIPKFSKMKSTITQFIEQNGGTVPPQSGSSANQQSPINSTQLPSGIAPQVKVTQNQHMSYNGAVQLQGGNNYGLPEEDSHYNEYFSAPPVPLQDNLLDDAWKSILWADIA